MPMPRYNHKSVANRRGFLLHSITLPEKIKVFSDGVEFNYRNKVEFGSSSDKTDDEARLGIFKRGGKEKSSLTEPLGASEHK